MYHIAVFDSLK